jgi:TRAP-type uncharacterized transport system substrate-binding protein
LLIGSLAVAAVVFSALAGVVFIRTFVPRTYQLNMVTDLYPRRLLLAEQIRDQASRHGLKIRLTSRQSGALDALEDIDSPSENKLALVPGGVKARDYPSVRLVATLAVDPLHVLVRPELAVKGYSALQGKRIALGPTTSASYHVARDVLAFVGLHSAAEGSGGYTVVSTTPEDLSRELHRIESLGDHDRSSALQALPDAVVFLAPTPSVLARQLVVTARYKLLPVPFAEALLLEHLNQPNSDGIRVDRSILGPTTIPPYAYGFDPPTPAQPCATVGAPLLLVAQDDADRDAVYRLLETIYDSPLTAVIHPAPLREQAPAFPLHTGTVRYIHHNDPMLTSETTSSLAKVGGGVGAFLSGMVALYSFLRLRKLSRFESYYRGIGRIERIAHGLDVDPAAPTDPESLRWYLEEQLTTLKCEVLRDFAEGGLRGEGLMAGIIALINDTRASVARMTMPRTGSREVAAATDGPTPHFTSATKQAGRPT